MNNFWSKVKKTKTCWIWIASIRNGYGAFKYQGKIYGSHRFSWYLAHGCWPKRWVLHTCNNKICVNPGHLYDGTPKQNYADMRAAGNEYKQIKKYASAKEQKRASFKRWYEKAKKEPGRARLNKWRKTSQRGGEVATH